MDADITLCIHVIKKWYNNPQVTASSVCAEAGKSICYFHLNAYFYLSCLHKPQRFLLSFSFYTPFTRIEKRYNKNSKFISKICMNSGRRLQHSFHFVSCFSFFVARVNAAFHFQTSVTQGAWELNVELYVSQVRLYYQNYLCISSQGHALIQLIS